MYPKRKQVFIRLVHFLVLHKNLWLTSDLVPFICHHTWQLGLILRMETGSHYSLYCEMMIKWRCHSFLATMQWVLPCPFDVHLSSPYQPGFCSLIHSLIWMSHSRPLVWPSSKSLQTINAEGGVEKKEPCYTVDGNVKWCNHYGGHYGGFSKNWI